MVRNTIRASIFVIARDFVSDNELRGTWDLIEEYNYLERRLLNVQMYLFVEFSSSTRESVL